LVGGPLPPSGESLANLTFSIVAIRGPSAHRAQAEQGSAASIAILNRIADSRLVLLNNCGHWPPFEKPAEWTAQVLAFLKGY
jgi:pimeloyl-ACP methyl ester carboxylesterase